MTKKIITIDGPVASGKSSVARKLGEKLSIEVLYTGKIYRSIAKKIITNNIDLNDKSKIIEIASTVKESDLKDNDLDNENIAKISSFIATIEMVREISNKLQRNFQQSHDLVIIEGRDSGSIVFPDADLKIFFTASQKIRANRRYNELQEFNFDVKYNDVLNNLILRDEQDSNRTIAPLVIPEDAVVVDSSELTFDETIIKVENLIKNKFNL